jgi:aminoglycoside phosphotransferase (APT) family kinase protein
MNQIVELPNDAAAALKRLRPQWQIDEVAGVELLEGGYTNDNYALTYRDSDYVLRLARPSPLTIDRAFEKRLLAGPIALLTAPLVAYSLPEGHMLTRRVTGPLLVDAKPDRAALAQYLARLHLRIPPLGRRYDLVQTIGRDLRVAAQRGELPPPWFAKEHESLTRAALQVRPCHNDLNPWNVIVSAADPGRWCTLDWEIAGDNDPLFDLICLAEGLGWSLDETDALIDAYLELVESPRMPTTQQRRTIRKGYFLREYAWALAQLASGNRRIEIEAQLKRSAGVLKEISG